LSAITGVAGSGESSPMACLPQDLRDSGRLLFVDPSAIRGSRRFIQATHNGAVDSIPKASDKAPGVKAGVFSAEFAGAAPHCNGAGVVWVDVGLMSGADVPCEVCEGRRFNDEVLGYTLGGKNIADVLELPAEQAAEYFTAKESKVAAAAKICDTLVSVGLGY